MTIGIHKEFMRNMESRIPRSLVWVRRRCRLCICLWRRQPDSAYSPGIFITNGQKNFLRIGIENKMHI
jgi:hypothetical protein